MQHSVRLIGIELILASPHKIAGILDPTRNAADHRTEIGVLHVIFRRRIVAEDNVPDIAVSVRDVQPLHCRAVGKNARAHAAAVGYRHAFIGYLRF